MYHPRPHGEVAEWSKAHAWKVCIRQRIEGSNPSLSAILQRVRTGDILYILYRVHGLQFRYERIWAGLDPANLLIKES